MRCSRLPRQQLSPSVLPFQTPNNYTARQERNVTAAGVGYVALPLVGINIAFESGTLDEEPRWVRIDDPGSV
jgi:hypothetical protein